MEAITRNVRDIEASERRVLERVLGQKLREDQQVVISVVSLDLTRSDDPTARTSQSVAPWRDIYEGLSDEEIDRLDHAVRQRADLTRAFE